MIAPRDYLKAVVGAIVEQQSSETNFVSTPHTG